MVPMTSENTPVASKAIPALKPAAKAKPVDPLVTQANNQATADTNAALAALPSYDYISGLGQALQTNLQRNQLTQAQTAQAGGQQYHDAFNAALPQTNAAMIGAGSSGAHEVVGAANLLQAMGANNAAALGGQSAAAAASTKSDLMGLTNRQSAVRANRQSLADKYLSGLQAAKADSLYKNALLQLKEQGLQIQAAKASRSGGGGGGGGGGGSAAKGPKPMTTAQRNTQIGRATTLYRQTASSKGNQYITINQPVYDRVTDPITKAVHNVERLDKNGNVIMVPHQAPNPNYVAGSPDEAFRQAYRYLLNAGFPKADANAIATRIGAGNGTPAGWSITTGSAGPRGN
jgi:hypothetical protein